MFENLGKILKGRFGKKDYLAKQVRIVQIFDLYKEGAGSLFPNGPEAKPVSLKDRVLTIETSGAAHANELRLREHEIIETINRHFGEEVIKRIVYRF